MARTADIGRPSIPRPTPGDVLAATDSDQPTVRKDVWSRSGSRYRVRAIVLLSINVLLFAGVGSFAYWLRTGVHIAPAQAAYWDELHSMFSSIPIGDRSHAATSLGALLLHPISVQDVPMQIPILGLLMAALIAIPILVAMLYRFWSSLPFIMVVGMLAVMPWLALTLLVSCALATAQMFRTRYRFVSALLALIPVVIYLVLAWSGTAEAVAGRIDPIDRVKFVAPWVMAIVASTLVFAVVLSIAKIVDYRPGAIAPLLALMFGLPVALFEFHVGRDELYYRLLESRSQNHFSDKDVSAELDAAVMEEWLHTSDPRHSVESVRARVETRWLFGLASDISPYRSALSRHQAELVADCDRFLKYFPDSRYAANALFVKGRSLDMRVDSSAFRHTKWLRYYDGFPSPASRDVWRLLAKTAPDTVLGRVALLRAAQLDAHAGDVERAIAKLDTVRKHSGILQGQEEASTSGAGALGRMLARQMPEDSLHVSDDLILLEATRLHDLLSANRDPLYGYDPLSGPRYRNDGISFGLLDLEPRHERYVENLQQLRQAYPHCQIQDNIDLEIAKASDSVESKIERLEALLAAFPDRDAVPEALFRLGAALREAEQTKRGDDTFLRLLTEHPDSIWASQARHYGRFQSASAARRDGVRDGHTGAG